MAFLCCRSTCTFATCAKRAENVFHHNSSNSSMPRFCKCFHPIERHAMPSNHGYMADVSSAAVVVAGSPLGSLADLDASVSAPTSSENFVSRCISHTLFVSLNLCTTSASIPREALAPVPTALPLHVPPSLSSPVLLALCFVGKRSLLVWGR